jgi:hypothetical protein
MLVIESAMVGVICAVFIFVFGICAHNITKTDVNNMKKWETIEAWVVKIEKNPRYRSGRYGYQPRFWVKMKYFIDGKEYESLLGSFTELQPGQSAPIIKNPRNNVIQFKSDVKASEATVDFGKVCMYIALAIIVIEIIRMVIAGQMF